MAMAHPSVTLSADTIHRPDEPRHFMRLKPVQRDVRILRGDDVMARSEDALWLLEVGKDVYDPVLYLPEGDVRGRLRTSERKSHCPLKGDARWFDLVDENGEVVEESIAWCYPEPFGFAADLAGHVAFDTRICSAIIIPPAAARAA